jgi:uncharacterized protein YndB with AHSA1/START domain
MSCIKEVVLPVEADEAWEAVTEPDALEAWLADEVELDLREGGSATFVLPGGEERSAIVEEVTPGERWSFWWWTRDGESGTPGSRVTFELTPAVGGTRVRVTESPVGPWAAHAHPGAAQARRELGRGRALVVDAPVLCPA